jgi:leader peptidase (prepilin peptidase)/N-methyltransferase
MVAALLSFGLLCVLSAVLAWIDIRHGIIPDWLNLAIAGVGLLKISLIGDAYAGIAALGEGAVIGGAFWLLRRLYFALRGVQGLGLGDVKFLAAAGIWVGVAGIPMVLLVATLTALGCVGVMQLSGRALTAQTSVSFGPFLAAGLLLTSGFQQYGFW